MNLIICELNAVIKHVFLASLGLYQTWHFNFDGDKTGDITWIYV